MNDGPGVLSWLLPLAAAGAILALYFLKTRRKPVLVPSTFLWRRTIEDRRVNALWQRLRKSLMLLLQLLAVAAAAVALFRPSWEGSLLVGGRYVFVIDNSASMQTTDVAPTRLDEAKRRALELIDKMGSGDTAMVVSFASRAKIEQSYTDNRERLRRAVRDIESTDATTSLDEALRLCAGGAVARSTASGAAAPDDDAQRAQAFVFSDGRFPDVAGDLLSRLDVVFVPIGKPTTDNLAITRLAVGRHPESPENAEALARLRNFGGAARDVVVELHIEGRLVDARRTTLAEDAQQDMVFAVADAPDGVWEVRIAAANDSLPRDDRAWVVLAPPTRTRLLVVTPGNRYLRSALATDEAQTWCDPTFVAPDYLQTDEYRTAAAGGASFDAVVFDRCSPPTMPACSTLFFAALPPGDAWRFDATVSAPQMFDTAQTNPLMQNVALGEVLLAESRTPFGPPGAQTLIDSPHGPLAVVAGREGFEDVVFGFALLDERGKPQTNWPLVDGAGFEQFVLNAAQYFGRGRSADDSGVLRPGQAVQVDVAAAADAVVELPDGRRVPLSATSRGERTFYETNRVGPYRVWQGDEERDRWAVNLFDPLESSPAVAESPTFKAGDVEIVGNANWDTARLEGWKPFLLFVLGFLGVEWYLYGRRAGL